jgi:hypothetical protein
MHKLITYILTFLPICVFAQVESDIYEYKNVDFDSVIVTIDYPNWKYRPKVRSVYFFSNGNNTLYKSYRNDTLDYISEDEYNNDKLIKTKNFSEVFSYDPDLKKDVGTIRDDYFNGREFIYNKEKLIKIQYYMSIEGSMTYDYDIIFEYDSLNRLIKETNLDKHIGYTAGFESNSDNIDTMYYKNATSSSYKTYDYFTDSILVKYFSDGKYTGYDWIYGDLENPREIKSFSNLNELINHLVYLKNNNGLITARFYKFKTPKSTWGGEMDITAEDKITVDYNDKGYPLIVKYFENDKLIMIKNLKYYAP